MREQAVRCPVKPRLVIVWRKRKHMARASVSRATLTFVLKLKYETRICDNADYAEDVLVPTLSTYLNLKFRS